MDFTGSLSQAIEWTAYLVIKALSSNFSIVKRKKGMKTKPNTMYVRMQKVRFQK
jgi:hypothetical protein